MRTAATDTCEFFEDAVSLGSDTSCDHFDIGGTVIAFGFGYPDFSDHANGYLTELRVWTEAKTQTYLADHLTCQLSKFAQNMWGYYPLTTGSGNEPNFNVAGKGGYLIPSGGATWSTSGHSVDWTGWDTGEDCADAP